MSDSENGTVTARCTREGCDREATCMVTLCVPAQGWAIDSHQPMRLTLGMPVCDEHFDELRVEDLADPKLKRGIYDIVNILARGKCPPDWDRAWLAKEPLTSSAAGVLDEQRGETT